MFRRSSTAKAQENVSEEVEVFGNFKKMCESKGLPYHSLKMKPFPIIHEDVVIHRVPFK